MRRIFISGALAVTILGDAFGAEAGPWQNWETQLHVGDPLVGRIWSTRDQQFVDPYMLADDLAEARFVLFGETHDNADHHRLQAWLIEQIATKRKPAVVMEMISRDQSQALQNYLAGSNPDPKGLGAAIDWAGRGWPDWSIYQPIAEAVLPADLLLLPGDPSRGELETVRTGGLKALEVAERDRLALTEPLPTALSEALSRELGESHCDLMQEETLASMTQVQRYRDAELANALLNADAGHGVILIAGNGHVRSDRGVPWYLARQAPDPGVTIVMLLEIEKNALSVDDLVPTSPDEAPVADFFWITPRAEREDPCEQLRRHLGK